MNQLLFDEDKHQYQLDGMIIPSVTQILHDSGLVNLDWVDKELLEEKSDLGKKVHSATELYDTNELDIDRLHQTLKLYLAGWTEFRENYGFVPTEIELQLSHPLYKYAGRIDRIGFIGKDLTLLDIKSGTKQKVHGIQTAGYKLLYDCGKKKTAQIKRRLIVYLSETGYKVEENRNPQDMNVFLAALIITNYKRGL